MTPLKILMPRTLDEAVDAQNRHRGAIPKAGGIDVLAHLKDDLPGDGLLNNLLAVEDDDLTRLADRSIGALCTLGRLARDESLRARSPVIAQAAAATATPQIRNRATIAGNLLQRPHCWYYRGRQFHCLKKGGSTCYAVHGENRYHAIFGDGPCHIVHPSSLAPALTVCDAVLTIRNARHGERTMPIEELFTMPDANVGVEHALGSDDLVVRIDHASAPISAHYEIRERQSFDWPLVMAAVALTIENHRISSARVCAGAVAPVPWRLRRVEIGLVGVGINDDERIRRACQTAVNGAAAMSDNAYKLAMLPVAIHRAVTRALGRPTDDPFDTEAAS